MKVSRFIAAAAVLFLITSAMAEEVKTEGSPVKKDNPPKTLFNTSDAVYSGYGGIYASYSKIGEADSCLAGGRGGLILNDSVVLGLSGTGLVYPAKREKISGVDYAGGLDRTNFGYGGFLAEYYFNPKDLVVFSIGTTIGGGSLSFYDEKDDDQDENCRSQNDNFFVIEPEAYIYVNLTRFCRVGAGISYRYVAGIGSDDFTDKDFSGPSAAIMAQFGWF